MIFIDAHVHIYDCYDLNIFFDEALVNFQKHTFPQGINNSLDKFVLIITDWAKQDWFKQLADSAEAPSQKTFPGLRNWQLYKTNEEVALVAKHKTTLNEIIILAGRKIITSEDLEILAIATTSRFHDSGPMKETVQAIQAENAVPVIPWAPGKWFGKRGQVISHLIQQKKDSNAPFFLCDNGNRPYFWPQPTLFSEGKRKGIATIAGSDPLHFASECNRAGCYVFSLPGKLEKTNIGSNFKKILLSKKDDIKLHGQLESSFRFFRNQVIMQIMKKKYRTMLSD